MDSPTLFGIDLAYVGVAALVLSVFNTIWAFRKFRGESRTSLRRVAWPRRVALEWRRNSEGFPRILDARIRNGPYRKATIEKVTLQTGLLRRREVEPAFVSLPPAPLEPDQPWTESFDAFVLHRDHASNKKRPRRFRVVVHYAGRRARSKRTKVLPKPAG